MADGTVETVPNASPRLPPCVMKERIEPSITRAVCRTSQQLSSSSRRVDCRRPCVAHPRVNFIHLRAADPNVRAKHTTLNMKLGVEKGGGRRGARRREMEEQSADMTFRSVSYS